MEFFRPIDGVLHAEDVPLPAIAAQHGTPCYVYSRAALETAYRAIRRGVRAARRTSSAMR